MVSLRWLYDKGYRLLSKGMTREAVMYYVKKRNIPKLKQIIRKECTEFGPESAQKLINIAITEAYKLKHDETLIGLGDILSEWYGNTRGAVKAYAAAEAIDKIEQLISKEAREFGPESAQKLINIAKQTSIKLGNKEMAEKVDKIKV